MPYDDADPHDFFSMLREPNNPVYAQEHLDRFPKHPSETALAQYHSILQDTLSSQFNPEELVVFLHVEKCLFCTNRLMKLEDVRVAALVTQEASIFKSGRCSTFFLCFSLLNRSKPGWIRALAADYLQDRLSRLGVRWLLRRVAASDLDTEVRQAASLCI
jgi:hypothetical protein